MSFQDKVVVVTGAAMGIGQATALAFAQQGARVALVDIDPQAGQSALTDFAAWPGRAIFVQCDVSSEAQVRVALEQVVARWGRLNVLVNNAGIYIQADILGTSLDDWERIMGVNLTGAFLCSKVAAEQMVSQGQGVIVNVASEAALVGIGGQVVYNVSKAGMVMLTRSCAVDLASRGVRVNCVCPGTTETPLLRAAVARAPDPSAARRRLESVRPLDRLGKPEEIAAAILFMASDEAGYATGSILSIDGGYTTQ